MSPQEIIDRTRRQIEIVKLLVFTLSQIKVSDRGELMTLCLLADELIETIEHPESHPEIHPENQQEGYSE